MTEQYLCDSCARLVHTNLGDITVEGGWHCYQNLNERRPYMMLKEGQRAENVCPRYIPRNEKTGKPFDFGKLAARLRGVE